MKMHFTMKQLLAKGHRGIHSLYFLAVAIEGHGFYAMAGGVLAVLAVLNVFLHFEGEVL